MVGCLGYLAEARLAIKERRVALLRELAELDEAERRVGANIAHVIRGRRVLTHGIA